MTVMPQLPAGYHPAALSPQDATRAQQLSRRRGLRNLAGLDLHVVKPPAEAREGMAFDLRIGGGLGRVVMPRDLLHHVLNMLDPASCFAAPDATGLLLELALEPALLALEGRFPFLRMQLDPASGTHQTTHAIGLSVLIGGVSGTLRLELDATAADVMTTVLAELPDAPKAMPDLPITLHLRLQSSEVSTGELATARTGDVVFADTLPDSNILLVCRERFVWRARRQGTTLQVLSPRLRPGTIGLDRWMMDNTHEPEEAGGLDEIPVRLAFELGRLELPLSEVSVLGPGHVFDLARDDSQPVDILANGRLIGRGRIVTVAGTIGVQIVHLGR